MHTSIKTRREFLQFLGHGAATAGLASALPILTGCGTTRPSSEVVAKNLPFKPLSPTDKDDLVLAAGFSSQLFLAWNTPLNSKGDRFGYNNDYIAVQPISSDRAYMWVNHESVHPLLMQTSKDRKWKKNKKAVDLERRSVGGSVVEIRKGEDGQWIFPGKSRKNFRIDGTTKIPLVAERDIEGTKEVEGTLANCAGGFTPWGTFLTCEENYDDFYGEYKFKDGKRTHEKGKDFYGWQKYYDNPPSHYGWVVEVDPKTKKAKKLTALGRFAHEGATVVKTKSGRCVVYMGDDKADECIYKFIADKEGTLETGELFVGDFKNGRWLALKRKGNPILEKNFRDQTEVLIRAREAAELLGATPMNRPEDIEQDPVTGAMFVALTNNIKRDDHHGEILKIVETDNDPMALSFKSETFLVGGQDGGLSCPDNLMFDGQGGLWVCTDIKGKLMNHGPYKRFMNNGLFYIPLTGPLAGQPYQVASAPRDAELTGICLAPDKKSIFLSVQHPGEDLKDINNLTSHWPEGGDSIPYPAVVNITGPALENLLG